MLSWKNYSEPVDVWSAGCIISEMLTGHVLFPGMDHVHHVELIFKLLGSPNDLVVDKICGEKTKQYLLMMPHFDGTDFRKELYTSELVPDEAVELVRRMMVLDPMERLTAKQALYHPFFKGINEEMQLTKERPRMAYDASGFDKLDLAELRAALEAEVGLFDSGRSMALLDPEPMLPLYHTGK